MHYLFVDFYREIQKGRQIKIYDPFFESIAEQYDTDLIKQYKNNNQITQIEEQEIEIRSPQINKAVKNQQTNFRSENKIKFLKDYDLNMLEVETFLFKDASIMQNKQIQETLKHHIVYLFALPIDFNHEAFLQEALQNRYEDVNNIRILMDFNENKQKKKSIILYFNDKDTADIFISQYNCFIINEKNEEYMLLISLQFVTFIPKSDQLQLAMEEQQKANLIELPNCPLCIEKLESSVSGFTLSFALNLFIYEVQGRWKSVKDACNTCMDRDILECHLCQETDVESLWLCLICGNMGCGRYKKGHAKEHWYQCGHCLSMELESERIWDYFDDKFVHRIMKGENKKTIIMNNFEKIQPNQDTNNRQQNIEQSEQEQEIVLAHQQQDSLLNQRNNGNNHMIIWDQWNDIKGVERNENQDEKFITDRVDNAIWEYCYVISHQMEEQRKYFEKKLEDVKRKNEDIQSEGQVSILLIEEDIKQIKEKRDKVKKLREATAKKLKTISDKNKDMESEIEKLELFINGIRNNIEHFETKQAQKLQTTISNQQPNTSQTSSQMTIGDGLKPNNKFSSALEEEILQESQKLQLLEQQLSQLYEKLQQE